MEKTIQPGNVSGSISAPPSKSMMQRAIAAALLASGTTKISNPTFCEDSLAAIRAAKSLGAKIKQWEKEVIIQGAGSSIFEHPKTQIESGESGLCIRLFTPISALCKNQVTLSAKGSLLLRPLGKIDAPLISLGAQCKTNSGKAPVIVKGSISGGKIEVDGSESSQFISGLLFALPKCKNDSILITKNLKSKPYIEMTVQVLRDFGIKLDADIEAGLFKIPANQSYKPITYTVEGDWSGAAFPLVAGAIAGKVTVKGLKSNSLQADHKILEALGKAGAKIQIEKDEVTISHSRLCGFEFDATDCPDLFPSLVALACNCKGISRITGARRLVHKESNRAESIAKEFGKMGGKIRLYDDVIEVFGAKLSGCEVDSHNDHRIAMACAVAALCAEGKTTIKNSECVSKSYLNFFSDLEKLKGGMMEKTENPFSFGNKFRVSVFGSSHGPHVGVEIEGCPAGISVSQEKIQLQLDRRKPGQNALTSQRKEEDKAIIESGIKNGKTTGKKIRMLILNKDTRPGDYAQFSKTPRPGHSDYPALVKYGKVQSGGGFFSGRMTAAFVMAGAIAKELLAKKGVRTMAFMRSIGKEGLLGEPSELEILRDTYKSPVRCPDAKASARMEEEVKKAMIAQDSVGGIVECRICGLPAGIGEPMFGGIESAVARAMFAIPAAKGIEFGAGFASSGMRGSQNNDEFEINGGRVATKSNNSGGILGGLSNGMPIVLRVAFKPTSSIYKEQNTVDLGKMQNAKLKIIGRHDPCIAIRAVPVVENVAAFCFADMLLNQKGDLNGPE